MNKTCLVFASRLALLNFAGLLAAASAVADEHDGLVDVQGVQQEFYASHGQSVPDELDLQTLLDNPALDAEFALIDQDQGIGNRATIDQSGTDNIAAVFQGFGDDNLANVLQNGASNYIAITQEANSNRIDQLSQQGNFNSATVNQYNGSNDLTLTQIYDYNRAVIDQYGGTSLNVTQTNPGGTSSSVNSLTLKAYAEPGANPNFAPVQLNGPGQTQISICNGSPAYCGTVLPN